MILPKTSPTPRIRGNGYPSCYTNDPIYHQVIHYEWAGVCNRSVEDICEKNRGLQKVKWIQDDI